MQVDMIASTDVKVLALEMKTLKRLVDKHAEQQKSRNTGKRNSAKGYNFSEDVLLAQTRYL